MSRGDRARCGLPCRPVPMDRRYLSQGIDNTERDRTSQATGKLYGCGLTPGHRKIIFAIILSSGPTAYLWTSYTSCPDEASRRSGSREPDDPEGEKVERIKGDYKS